MPEREARIVFGWKYDEASQKRVEQGLDRINKVTADQTRTLGGYSAKTQAGLDSVAAGFRRGSQSSERMRESFREWEQAGRSVEGVASKINGELADMAYAAQIDKIAADAIKAAKASKDWAAALKLAATQLSEIGASDDEIQSVAQQIGAAAQGRGGAGGRAIGTLGRIGREVRALPAIQLSGSLSTDAIGKILYTANAGLTALGASTGTVAAASAIAAPAIIATALAVAEYTRQLEIQKSRLAGALEGQTRYYDAIQSLTAEEAAQEVEQETRRLEFLRQQRAETQNAIDNAFRQAQQLFGGDVTARALEAAGQLPTAQLREQLNELDAQIASTESYTVRLTQAQAAGSFAANDLAQREQELADARRGQIEGDAAAVLEADRMTAAQRQARIAENYRTLQLLEQQRSQTAAAGLATDDLDAAITRLTRDQIILIEVTQSNADVLAEMAEASRRAMIVSEAVAKSEQMLAEDRQQRVQEIDAEIGRYESLIASGALSSETAAALTHQIEDLTVEKAILTEVTVSLADATAQQTAAVRTLTDQTDSYFKALENEVKAQEAVTAAAQAYTDYLAKAAEERERLETEAQGKRAEIEENANEKRAEIEERGAKDREKILRDFTRTYTNAVGERDALAGHLAKIAAADRLKDQKENEDDSLEQAEKAREKQLRSLERSQSEQQARLEASLRREADTRIAAMNQAQVDLVNAKNAEAMIASYGAGTQRTIHQTMWGDLSMIASNYAQSLVRTVGFILSSATSPYGSGTYYPPAVGGQQSFVYSPTINANGLNEQQAEQVAYRAFRTALHDARAGQMGGR